MICWERLCCKNAPHSATHGSLFGIPASKSGNVLVDSVGAGNDTGHLSSHVGLLNRGISSLGDIKFIKPRIKPRDRIKGLPTNAAGIVRVQS